MISKAILQMNLNKAQRRVEILQAKLERMRAAKFSEGQVAHHKEYGNVLITDVKVNKNVYYEVQTTKGEQIIAETELIAFTPNTNTLYG